MDISLFLFLFYMYIGRTAHGRRTDDRRTADGWWTDGGQMADEQRTDGGLTADGRRKDGGRTVDPMYAKLVCMVDVGTTSQSETAIHICICISIL